MKQGRIEEAWSAGAKCQSCGIRDLVLFADLAKDDFGLIHLPIDEFELLQGQQLYSAQQEGDSLYTIRSGLVKLVQYLPDGGQRIVRLLKRGAVAGLETLVGQPYEHTAVALQKASVCRIPRQVIDRLSRETPRLHAQLMLRWHDSLRQADDWLTELSTGKAPQRLARLLMQIVDADGTVSLFPREDLGAMLGITTEHASRTVAELKRQEAIFELSANSYLCNLDLLQCIGSADC